MTTQYTYRIDWTKLVLTLSIPLFLFMLGLGLFALQSIDPTSAFEPDVQLGLTVSPRVNEEAIGIPFVYDIHYQCAASESRPETGGDEFCQGVIISATIPTQLERGDIEVVQITHHNEHIQSEVYDETTGIATFIFNQQIPVGSSGMVGLETRFPLTSTHGTQGEIYATASLVNGFPAQSNTASVMAIVPQDEVMELATMADTYVSMLEPEGNFNNDQLQFEVGTIQDPVMGGHCPALTKMVYMKFDVDEVDFEVDQARLNMSISSCGGETALPTMQLFLADSSWDESNMTWNSRPPMLFGFRDTLELSENGVYYWESNRETGQDSLASYLAYRQANGESGPITLGVLAALPFGCYAEAPPVQSLAFRDREGSVGRAACSAGASVEPTLQLGGSDTVFEPLGKLAPTSITMQSMQAAHDNPLRFVPLIVGGLLAAMSLVVLSKQEIIIRVPVEEKQ